MKIGWNEKIKLTNSDMEFNRLSRLSCLNRLSRLNRLNCLSHLNRLNWKRFQFVKIWPKKPKFRQKNTFFLRIKVNFLGIEAFHMILKIISCLLLLLKALTVSWMRSRFYLWIQFIDEVTSTWMSRDVWRQAKEESSIYYLLRWKVARPTLIGMNEPI